jgi:hypothetical protein
LLWEYENRVVTGRQLPLKSNNMKMFIGFKGCRRYIDVVNVR